MPRKMGGFLGVVNLSMLIWLADLGVKLGVDLVGRNANTLTTCGPNLNCNVKVNIEHAMNRNFYP